MNNSKQAPSCSQQESGDDCDDGEEDINGNDTDFTVRPPRHKKQDTVLIELPNQ